MQEILLKIRYFEKGLSNILKNVNFIFPFKPSPFYWMKLSKTKAVWKRWPITLQVTKQVQKNSFIRYILSDQVWWCNVKQFLSYSKNYIYKFLQANPWHLKLFHLHLCFWIWRVCKRREKITRTWISREWKELFRWNKKTFFSF